MPEDGYSANQTLDAKKRLAFKAYWSTGKNYDGIRSHTEGSVFNMWSFIIDDEADCRDMSSWWVKLCNSGNWTPQTPFSLTEVD